MGMIRHFDANHRFLHQGYYPKKAGKDIVADEEAFAKE